MNRLYLLIPAIKEDDAGQDIAYLKLLGNVNIDVVVRLLGQIIRSLRLIEGEDVKIIYDKTHLKPLIKIVRTVDESKQANGEMPQIENLLLFFNDALSIQELESGKTKIRVNGMTVDEGLVNAFVESGSDADTLLNKAALNSQVHPIQIESHKGIQLQLDALECDAAEVYLWLVENRKPVRKLDRNYKKHTSHEKLGKRGVKISPISYTEQQLQNFLKRAVVANKGLRELYFKDNAQDKIIVFWDENLKVPSYHAFEIEANDMFEIQKMYKRGGRTLIDRIADTSIID